jgi:hypothetical protein
MPQDKYTTEMRETNKNLLIEIVKGVLRGFIVISSLRIDSQLLDGKWRLVAYFERNK